VEEGSSFGIIPDNNADDEDHYGKDHCQDTHLLTRLLLQWWKENSVIIIK